MGSAVLTALAVVGALLLGAYVIAVLDRMMNLRLAGQELRGILTRDSFARPVFETVRLLGKEDVVPGYRDRSLYPLGPVYLFASVLLAVVVIPVAPGWVAADLATGILFFQAVIAQVAIALLMAGWGSHSRGGVLGSMRFVGQMISYEMPFAITTISASMVAGSLSTVAIVESQAEYTWNIIFQPLGFIIFFISAFAVGFWAPFDLADTDTELAGGVFGEYTGPRLALFKLAHLSLILALASLVVVVFLGGWLGPVLPPALWFVLKLLAVIAAMVSVRRLSVRARLDQLMAASWKYLLPLALVNIAWVGVLLLLVQGG